MTMLTTTTTTTTVDEGGRTELTSTLLTLALSVEHWYSTICTTTFVSYGSYLHIFTSFSDQGFPEKFVGLVYGRRD